MKALVIGDTHLDNSIPGLLDKQLETLDKLVESNRPKIVVFLGDIFHKRKPNPEVIVKTFKFFKRVAVKPGLSNIFVLRGNHDSDNKSDDGLTALSILEYPGSKVKVITHPYMDPRFGFAFIPHYENEEELLLQCKIISDYSKELLVFGHFGYNGCLNSTGHFDSDIDQSVIKNRTILGHIHEYHKENNITILGTPWTTNFGEVDYPKYVGILESEDGTKWSELKLQEVDFGVRHYVAPLESLESLKEEIDDPKYFTILRVILSKFSDDTSNDLRAQIYNEYAVGHVSLKFEPIFDKKLNNRLSDFDPQKALAHIDSTIIDKYLEEQASTIPTEVLKAGLDKITEYGNQES